jgi:hypothetical protein
MQNEAVRKHILVKWKGSFFDYLPIVFAGLVFISNDSIKNPFEITVFKTIFTCSYYKKNNSQNLDMRLVVLDGSCWQMNRVKNIHCKKSSRVSRCQAVRAGVFPGCLVAYPFWATLLSSFWHYFFGLSKWQLELKLGGRQNDKILSCRLSIW